MKFIRSRNVRTNRPLRAKKPAKPRSKWIRVIGVALAVPPIAIVLVCLGLAYQIYSSNKVMAQHSRFPTMNPPVKAQTFLVFSPHCDDETLGAGGLIHQARKNGSNVQIVFFTNGDGFRIGVAQEYSELQVKPADFVKYGYMRQGEARTALQKLGVSSDCITFLGYPDRGLMPMWTSYWSPDTPYRSTYTDCDHSPYTTSTTPRTEYCGQSVLADVMAQMDRVQPTDIFVTHPCDDHPDHAAASVFVRSALEQLRAAGRPWAKTARLHYYLVHRGDWPVPQGLHEDAALPPPAQLVTTGTQWQQFPLSRRDVQNKYAAIKRYRSQTELTGRFLFSFARENELFGEVDSDTSPALPILPHTHPRLTTDLATWRGLTPVALDPAGDSIVRAMQSGADIVRIFTARQGNRLVIRTDMSGNVIKGGQYRVTLRPMMHGLAQPRATSLSFVAGDEDDQVEVSGAPGATASYHGNTIVYTLPWSGVALPDGVTGDLYVQVDTRVANMVIDRTGFRAVPLPAFYGPMVASTAHVR